MDNKFVILITGGRKFKDQKPIRDALQPYVQQYGAANITLRHGKARGADQLSGFIARQLGITDIQERSVEYYGLDWDLDGLNAGNRRNDKMLEEDPKPNIVLAFPDEESRGTFNCIESAVIMGFDVKVYYGAVSEDHPRIQALKADIENCKRIFALTNEHSTS